MYEGQSSKPLLPVYLARLSLCQPTPSIYLSPSLYSSLCLRHPSCVSVYFGLSVSPSVSLWLSVHVASGVHALHVSSVRLSAAMQIDVRKCTRPALLPPWCALRTLLCSASKVRQKSLARVRAWMSVLLSREKFSGVCKAWGTRVVEKRRVGSRDASSVKKFSFALSLPCCLLLCCYSHHEAPVAYRQTVQKRSGCRSSDRRVWRDRCK